LLMRVVSSPRGPWGGLAIPKGKTGKKKNWVLP
jgi:hypothetical protein